MATVVTVGLNRARNPLTGRVESLSLPTPGNPPNTITSIIPSAVTSGTQAVRAFATNSLRDTLGEVGRDILGTVVSSAGQWVSDQISGTVRPGANAWVTATSPLYDAASSAAAAAALTSCPAGYRMNPTTGICEQTGIGGAVARVLPGGSTGYLPTDGYGSAVVGAFGTPALQPRQAGTVNRKDGTTAAVLRCPGGMVLGRDDLCYPVQVIGRRGKWRKHRPAPKPLISSGDVQAINRAARVQNKVKNLGKKVGLTTCKRKAR